MRFNGEVGVLSNGAGKMVNNDVFTEIFGLDATRGFSKEDDHKFVNERLGDCDFGGAEEKHLQRSPRQDRRCTHERVEANDLLRRTSICS